jgi:hypothetical protein
MKDLFKPEEYRLVSKKVKIITADSQEKLMKQLEQFEKEHMIIDIKQHTAKMMFVFYTE